MNRQIAYVFSSSLGLAAAAAALTWDSVGAQPVGTNPVNGAVQGSAPVSVVNTPTVTVGNTPLPVTGNVAVSGIIDARQSGPWTVGATQSGTWFVGASQIGSWNVGLVGTPTVKVDLGSAPLLVKNISDAADVFQTSVQMTIPDNFCCGPVGEFIVPGGKRLVIEDVSASAHINNEIATIQVTTTAAGSTVDHSVLGMQTGANQEAAAGRVTRLYADAGTTVKVSAHRNGLSGPATFTVSLSGYYVPMP